jgi:DNA-directed RNA polymerase beta subunit
VYIETCANYEDFGVKDRGPRLMKLGDDGLPMIDDWIKDGDAISSRINAKTGEVRVTFFHGNDQGRVVEVLRTTNMDNHVVAKIKLDFSRPVEVGNKVSSVHGQKGTVGQIMSREDLPFTHGRFVMAGGRRQFTGKSRRRPTHGQAG